MDNGFQDYPPLNPLKGEKFLFWGGARGGEILSILNVLWKSRFKTNN